MEDKRVRARTTTNTKPPILALRIGRFGLHHLGARKIAPSIQKLLGILRHTLHQYLKM